MNDPCYQSDAQIDKALGQDWPRKGATNDTTDRERLIAFLQSREQIHGKARDEWKAAGSVAQENYHNGAVQECLFIIDHLERLP